MTLAQRKTALAAALGTIAVVVYPLIFRDDYHLGVGITAGALAISTVGVVLLLGLAHQLAIGQAAFSIIGGYTTGILCVDYGWDPFLAMIVGAALTMLVAYAIATPILKLRGFVLVMATLALHLMLIVVAFELPITGGRDRHHRRAEIRDFRRDPFRQRDRLFLRGVGDRRHRHRHRPQYRPFARSAARCARSPPARPLPRSVGIDINRYKAQMFVHRRRHGERRRQPDRALSARHGPDRLRLRLQPQSGDRDDRRRSAVDLGRRARRGHHHRPARGAARSVAAAVGSDDHGRR